MTRRARLAAVTLAIAGASAPAGAGAAPATAAPATAAPAGAVAASAREGAGGDRAQLAPLTVIERSHGAFARPDYRSRRLATVAARRPITGSQTVLPVLGTRTARDGRVWQHVLLPGRPNGAAGWITSRFTRYAGTARRLHVDLSARRVTVVHDGRVERTFGVIVGKPSTPTPRGRFFVEESVVLAPGLSGAPYALALSARSDVLQEFDGGPGQIALHGLGGVGGVIGSAVSHGCIRLASSAIGWLVRHVGAGTTVTIAG